MVDILDLNDNSPVPTLPGGFTFNIAENLAGVTPVGIVSASDTNITSPNHDISFNIAPVGNWQGVFTISTSTGQITALGPLDREATPNYTFTVVIQDAGTPCVTLLRASNNSWR